MKPLPTNASVSKSMSETATMAVGGGSCATAMPSQSGSKDNNTGMAAALVGGVAVLAFAL